MSEALDHWVPDYSVRTYHRREAAADQTGLWRAATTIRLADTRRLGKLVSWRIPGVHPSQTYHELFRAYPFTVLEETDDLLVSGLCGKIWTLARDYPGWRTRTRSRTGTSAERCASPSPTGPVRVKTAPRSCVQKPACTPSTRPLGYG